MACNSNTAGHRAKAAESLGLGEISNTYCGIFDVIIFQGDLGSFDELFSSCSQSKHIEI